MRRCLLIQAKVRSPTHRRGRTSKTCWLRLATTWMVIFMVAAQAASLLVAYPASAQTRRTLRQARCRFHSSGRAPSRSCTDAAVITTARTRPVVSTAMCRLGPLIFLALSQPRAAFGTVSAARIDWESMTAAVGSALRHAAVLTWARSASCSRVKVPSSRQAAK